MLKDVCRADDPHDNIYPCGEDADDYCPVHGGLCADHAKYHLIECVVYAELVREDSVDE